MFVWERIYTAKTMRFESKGNGKHLLEKKGENTGFQHFKHFLEKGKNAGF